MVCVLEATHLYDQLYSNRWDDIYKKDRANIPISVNDAKNGLLLCPTCHALFDSPKNFLKIDKTGKIVVSKDAGESIYLLNGTFVSWKDNIGTNDYPSSTFLEIVYKLETKSRDKRIREIIEESEEDADDEIGDEQLPKASGNAAKKRGKPSRKRTRN